MVTVTKVISTSLDNAKKRIIKILGLGKQDIKTPYECMPYGLDSNPIKDMVAIYAPSNESGKYVIVGYLNKNQKAEPGEYRTFATDSDGEEKFYTWMKADGTMEIGGSAKHMVRFEELEIGFNQLKTEFNALVTSYNAHTHLYIPPLVPAPVTPIPTATALPVGVASAASIADAKIDEIKTL